MDVALELDEQVLSIRRTFLPAFHIQLGETMHNLAQSYFDAERYDDALMIRNEELEIFRQSLPQSDPRIAECMEQLAQTYSALGRAEDALQCDLDVLKLRRQNNDEHHPEVVAALINLSTSYLELGEWALAIPYLEDALVSQESYFRMTTKIFTRQCSSLLNCTIRASSGLKPWKCRRKCLNFAGFTLPQVRSL